MHSRKKGKSKSNKPNRTKPPEWVPYTGDEVKEIVVKFAREGIPPSKIGLVLRDQYGIPDIALLTGKKVTKIMQDNKVSPEIPEDMRNLILKALHLREHLDKHKKDLHNKRGLHLIEAKIMRLSKYYRKTGRLQKDWRYDPDKARLLVKT